MLVVVDVVVDVVNVAVFVAILVVVGVVADVVAVIGILLPSATGTGTSMASCKSVKSFVKEDARDCLFRFLLKSFRLALRF